MVNGGITHGNTVVNAAFPAGQFPVFIEATRYLPPPAQIYCGLVSNCLSVSIIRSRHKGAHKMIQAGTSAQGGTGLPKLAVYSDTDSWSLCPTGAGPSAQVNVVYRATPNNGGVYIYDQCYAVDLQIIEG